MTLRRPPRLDRPLRPPSLAVLPALALALAVQLSPAAARSWLSTDLPSPQNDPGGICGRKARSSVCDPDGYLSQSDADEIQGLANFINEGTHGFKKLPCPGGTSGPQVAVAIIGSMRAGFAAGDKKTRAFQFARDLHDRWGVGDPACQNGIVLFFSVTDRAMGFSTGAGVKPVFTDAMVPAVMNSIAPLLRQEDYGRAIVEAVTAIGNILSGGKPPGGDGGGGPDYGTIFFGTIIASAVIGSAISGSRSRDRYRRCKETLTKIDNDRRRASAKEYVATSCPICLEDFDAAPPPNAAATSQNGQPAPTQQSNNNNTGGGGGGARAGAKQQSSSVSGVDATDVEAQPLSSDFGATSHQAVALTTTPAGNGSANGIDGDGDGDSNQTVTLMCGHKFHKSCILSWMSGPRSNSQTCPVCRQPVHMSGAEVRVGDTVRVEERTNSGRPSGWDVYDPEYDFRMQRAHYFYPDFITYSMMDSWQRDRYRNDRPMATSPAFVAVDPVVVAEAARASGSGGSSFSFGGGSSAGGGGGGGGW